MVKTQLLSMAFNKQSKFTLYQKHGKEHEELGNTKKKKKKWQYCLELHTSGWSLKMVQLNCRNQPTYWLRVAETFCRKAWVPYTGLELSSKVAEVLGNLVL